MVRSRDQQTLFYPVGWNILYLVPPDSAGSRNIHIHKFRTHFSGIRSQFAAPGSLFPGGENLGESLSPFQVVAVLVRGVVVSVHEAAVLVHVVVLVHAAVLVRAAVLVHAAVLVRAAGTEYGHAAQVDTRTPVVDGYPLIRGYDFHSFRHGCDVCDVSPWAPYLRSNLRNPFRIH